MNRVAIIILNWNGIEDTLECLESFEKQSYRNLHIVVIDNGSVDMSKLQLDIYKEGHSNSMDIIYEPKNLGFAGGVNVGIKWALDNDYEYVALFNNDAIADKHWVENLVKGFTSKNIGISTGLLLHRDGKTIDSSGDWMSIWGLAYPRKRGYKTETAPVAGVVFGGSGGATMYKTKMFKDIGFFDEDFFAYYEDVDISFRAQLTGWKAEYTPLAIAYHKQGATSNKLPGFAVYQTFKNLPLLFVKNVPRYLLFRMGVRFYFAYWVIVLNAIKNGNGKPAIRGVMRSVLLTPKKLSERRRIQKNIRVTKEYIKSVIWNDLPPDQTGMRKLMSFFYRK